MRIESKPKEEESAKAPAKSKKQGEQGASKGPVKEMTEEEKKEAQLKADLNHTNELFGVAGSLDNISVKSKEEYTDFINRFFAKVNVLNVSGCFFRLIGPGCLQASSLSLEGSAPLRRFHRGSFQSPV